MCVLLGLSALGAVGLGTGAAIAADVGLTAGVAGGVLSTVGGFQQADAAQKAAEYQADVAEQNKRIALREAETIGLQGRQEKKELRERMLAQEGSARTGYAANGVVLGSGTPAEYEADVAQAYSLDSKNLEYNIATKQWQKRVEATNYENQAKAARMTADNYGTSKVTSLLSGMFGTIGTGMSGAAGGAKLGKVLFG